MNKILLIQGDALEVLKSLPADSVHCIVTSPPYYGLRDYRCDGQLGLEPTYQEHIDVMVRTFREARRVLHPSGALYVNYGDSYATGAGGARNPGGDALRYQLAESNAFPKCGPNRMKQDGLKPKDLMGMPWRLALALQADGYWLRSDIIWHKTNAMPGSVEDRLATNHEYMFFLTKSERYFFDRDAVREKTGKESTWEEYIGAAGASYHEHGEDEVEGMQQKKRDGFKNMTHPLGASKRTVWSIATERSKYKHFATFPKKLVEPCIKASTSEGGCCPNCLQPWKKAYQQIGWSDHGARHKRPDAPGAELSQTSSLRTGKIKVKKPIGWKQNCKCPEAPPIPCTVMDIFSGTGTTGVVAARLGRSYIGIELDPAQIENAYDNISTDQPLLNEVEVDQVA